MAVRLYKVEEYLCHELIVECFDLEIRVATLLINFVYLLFELS